MATRSLRPRTVMVWPVAVGGRLVMLSTTAALGLCALLSSTTRKAKASVPVVRAAAV